HRCKQETPEAFALHMKAIGSAVEIARVALGTSMLDLLGSAMKGNAAILKTLGVSTPAVEAACDAAVAAGALAAKLSGAGGGGAVIALLGPQSDPDRVVAALRAAGALDAFVTEVPAS
ncbi:MAG TPA: mevalonate kinase, partial [Planctomycetota bacterium]|nr:mevalonate kinase [Planctomycetota bacterium]